MPSAWLYKIRSSSKNLRIAAKLELLAFGNTSIVKLNQDSLWWNFYKISKADLSYYVLTLYKEMIGVICLH